MTIKVDLLDRPGKRMGFDPVIIFLVLIVIVFIAFFIYWGKHYDDQMSLRKDEINKYDQKIRALESKIPDIQKQEKENQALEEQINAIKQLVFDPIRYRNLLDEIAYIMPNTIFIQNLNIEPGNQTLQFGGLAVEIGEETPLNSISKFMEAIRNSPILDTPNLASTSRTQYEGRTAFGFAIEVKYKPDAAAKQ
ncbi:MAG: PilN domain-containing protein [Firmicutes bacterium]|nr:PilN domain-containing protein [Bacillota bacterium]